MHHARAGIVLLPLLIAGAAPHNCSEFQTKVVRDAYRAVANSDACAALVTADGDALWIDWSCDNTDCVFVLRATAPGLPDCAVGGLNLRANVSDAITRCSSAPTPSSTESSSTGIGKSGGQGHRSGRPPAFAQLLGLILAVGISFYL